MCAPDGKRVREVRIALAPCVQVCSGVERGRCSDRWKFRTSWPKFVLFDSLGSVVWLGTYMGLGYLFADQLEAVAAYALRMGSSIVILLVLACAAWIAGKYIHRRRFLRKLSMARITAEELHRMLEAGQDVMVVDLRLRMEEDPDDSIPGALRMSAEDLAERSHEIPRDRDIVLLCS